MQIRSKLLVSALVCATLSGCQAQEAAVEETTAPKLPVSINAAMVAMVDHSSDYLFALGNGDMPRNDHDWDLVRVSAYETMLSGKVIQIEGTGEYDAQWVTNPEWDALSDQLTMIGSDALNLVEEKSTDTEAWRAVGDRLVQNCLTCHEKFKPEVPSEGILHESTERESRGESIFD